MTQEKKLIKQALKKPWLYTFDELIFFQSWLKRRKERKAAKIQKDKVKD
jgi:hypothetical protein